ncbi:hypothetical protein AYK26_02375 [Euryarchaeota archaeon SM23-78]|nr:MAG: hypothetical protein AYK26_02375 [Euryarchaeota archaeon SM23-78]MBW3000870.1 hypothetical protein [Candidatus Woesearchaeota archaeon]
MKTGVRGIIKDILLIYVVIRLVIIWLSRDTINASLGVLIILLGLSAVWFMLERIFGGKH